MQQINWQPLGTGSEYPTRTDEILQLVSGVVLGMLKLVAWAHTIVSQPMQPGICTQSGKVSSILLLVFILQMLTKSCSRTTKAPSEGRYQSMGYWTMGRLKWICRVWSVLTPNFPLGRLDANRSWIGRRRRSYLWWFYRLTRSLLAFMIPQ